MAGDRQQVPPWWTDPTENVKALVEADRKRQDDLRSMQMRHDQELRKADARRQDEKAELRAEHAREMRKAEADRIDAIRAVDVGNTSLAAQVSATQASTLAAQVATSAETLRNQVAAAATAAATALATALEPMLKSIEDLRRAQYEAQGQRTQVVESRDVRADTRQGATVNLTALSVLIGALLVAVALYAALHK